jgi:hypothetical protein
MVPAVKGQMKRATSALPFTQGSHIGFADAGANQSRGATAIMAMGALVQARVAAPAIELFT